MMLFTPPLRMFLLRKYYTHTPTDQTRGTNVTGPTGRIMDEEGLNQQRRSFWYKPKMWRDSLAYLLHTEHRTCLLTYSV